MQKPKPHAGLRACCALCKNLTECAFYSEILGMKLV